MESFICIALRSNALSSRVIPIMLAAPGAAAVRGAAVEPHHGMLVATRRREQLSIRSRHIGGTACSWIAQSLTWRYPLVAGRGASSSSRVAALASSPGSSAVLSSSKPLGDDAKPTGTMDLVFVAAEVAPWSKTGGLGDVMAALPVAMAKLGHRVMVVTPRCLTACHPGQLSAQGLPCPALCSHASPLHA